MTIREQWDRLSHADQDELLDALGKLLLDPRAMYFKQIQMVLARGVLADARPIDCYAEVVP